MRIGPSRRFRRRKDIPGSFKGRTAGFEPADGGSNPSPGSSSKGRCDMDSMLSRQWKTVEGTKVKNAYAEMAEALQGQRTVYIGTDSQQDGQRTQFVTVVVIHNPGKGGRAFYTKETVPRIKSLRERLLKEVWLSVATALEVNPMLAEESNLEIHVDANPNTKFKSSAYVKELTSMVVSQGFEAVLKPEAWAAMHVADHVVKYKVIGR